jgi:hypothetical protein
MGMAAGAVGVLLVWCWGRMWRMNRNEEWLDD